MATPISLNVDIQEGARGRFADITLPLRWLVRTQREALVVLSHDGC